MYDYILVYFMMTAAAMAPSDPGTRSRPVQRPVTERTVSVQERFDSEARCRARIEEVRGLAARSTVPSERYEFACHPVPRAEAETAARTS